MKTGIHLIGDLHRCNFSAQLGSKEGAEQLKQVISSEIEKAGLKELGNFYHYFEPYAVTAVICLAESHISFHTWAKEKYTSCDVFVCNYQNDNTEKARQIFDFLVTEIFQPKEVKKQEIER